MSQLCVQIYITLINIFCHTVCVGYNRILVLERVLVNGYLEIYIFSCVDMVTQDLYNKLYYNAIAKIVEVCRKKKICDEISS